MNKYNVAVILAGGKSVSVPVFASSKVEAEHKAALKAGAMYRTKVQRVQGMERLKGDSPL